MQGDWFLPTTHIFEDDDNFYLLVEMPGVDEKSCGLDTFKDEIIVTGRVDRGEEPDEQIIYSEFNEGNFHRHFVIPDGVDRTAIKAKLKNGLFFITMPKKEEYKPRKIHVEVG